MHANSLLKAQRSRENGDANWLGAVRVKEATSFGQYSTLSFLRLRLRSVREITKTYPVFISENCVRCIKDELSHAGKIPIAPSSCQSLHRFLMPIYGIDLPCLISGCRMPLCQGY